MFRTLPDVLAGLDADRIGTDKLQHAIGDWFQGYLAGVANLVTDRILSTAAGIVW